LAHARSKPHRLKPAPLNPFRQAALNLSAEMHFSSYTQPTHKFDMLFHIMLMEVCFYF
jgi:hypothetical protein